MLLLDDVGSDVDVASIAERLIEAASEPFLIEGNEIFIGVSIGIAFARDWQTTPETLIRNADEAMYRAKDRASGYEVFDDAMHVRAMRRLH